MSEDNYFSMLLVCNCLKPKAACTCPAEDDGDYEHREVYPPFGLGRIRVNPADRDGPYAWWIEQA
jgi:hypothetical protein